jgi:hypothetical protein
VIQGRYGPIPEGRQDLRRLWALASPLTSAIRPSWLDAVTAPDYRLVATVSLARLSTVAREEAEREFEAMEMARLVVDVDVTDADIRHIYVAALKPEPVWSIGILSGTAPWMLEQDPRDHGGRQRTNPVLTGVDVSDTVATSVADPFLFRSDECWHMFFEVDSWRSWKGEIGLATSADGLAWTYEGIVLAEPFHLSYPQVFAAEDGIFMIPESAQAEAVRLYRARRFPREWEHVCDLVHGLPFADPTVLRHDGRWWLFSETSGGRDDTLRLFHAGSLAGPWEEHPASPIVHGDAAIARPAGRIVQAAGKLVRFAQNCRPAYGTDVRAVEILTLSTTEYAERPLLPGPMLRAGAGWNAGGMHHADPVPLGPDRWLAAVDGWRMEDDIA